MENGSTSLDLEFFQLVCGNMNKIKMAANIKTTPANLLGTALKMAQKGKKQNSGTMEAGVTRGSAGI